MHCVHCALDGADGDWSAVSLERRSALAGADELRYLIQKKKHFLNTGKKE
jgi:hypothetical protein